MLIRMCYMERVIEKRIPWEQTYSINSSWNNVVRQTQVYQKLLYFTPELIMPVHLLKHLTHNFYDGAASSSHNCFTVLFLTVLTGLYNTLLVTDYKNLAHH